MRIAVITVSDRASKGVYEDLSGPAIEAALKELVPGVELERDLVPDERLEILAAFARHPGADWILTTGGTGPAPRDVTPEATRDVIEREMPGLAELLRWEGYRKTPLAVLSRGIAGLCGSCLIVNLPGSPRAVREGMETLAGVLPHAVQMARGEDLEHKAEAYEHA